MTEVLKNYEKTLQDVDEVCAGGPVYPGVDMYRGLALGLLEYAKKNCLGWHKYPEEKPEKKGDYLVDVKWYGYLIARWYGDYWSNCCEGYESEHLRDVKYWARIPCVPEEME